MVPHIVGTAIAPGAAMGVEDDGRYGRYGAGLELHKANRIKWESMRCSSTRVTRGYHVFLGLKHDDLSCIMNEMSLFLGCLDTSINTSGLANTFSGCVWTWLFLVSISVMRESMLGDGGW